MHWTMMVPVISAENLKAMSVYGPGEIMLMNGELHLVMLIEHDRCHGEYAYHIIDMPLRQK